jgi:hypothetical protein
MAGSCGVDKEEVLARVGTKDPKNAGIAPARTTKELREI